MTKPPGAFARTALATQSDDRLVRLLRDGQEQAFDEIVRRYRGPLVAFATAIVNPTRAEDVVQTALEKAHRALRADDREINLRPWLFTIVRNGSLNLIRAEPVTDELDPWLSPAAESEGPQQVAERNEEMDRLFTAICALPEAQREALVRRELEGVGHGEIAAQLGTSSTAVRGLIFRARTQLRNAMGAMVPFHLLRGMLAEGSAIGAAGGGASAALLGSAGAKGGAAAAAAVLALGAGIAVERNHRNSNGDVAVAEAAQEGPVAGSSGGRAARGSSPASGGTAPAGASNRSGGGRDGSRSANDDERGSSSGGANGPGGGGRRQLRKRQRQQRFRKRRQRLRRRPLSLRLVRSGRIEFGSRRRGRRIGDAERRRRRRQLRPRRRQ